MPVLSTGELKYIMITLHKKISLNFFSQNFGLGNFSGNFGKI